MYRIVEKCIVAGLLIGKSNVVLLQLKILCFVVNDFWYAFHIQGTVGYCCMNYWLYTFIMDMTAPIKLGPKQKDKGTTDK